jgi:hypothetical protein
MLVERLLPCCPNIKKADNEDVVRLLGFYVDR